MEKTAYKEQIFFRRFYLSTAVIIAASLLISVLLNGTVYPYHIIPCVALPLSYFISKSIFAITDRSNEFQFKLLLFIGFLTLNILAVFAMGELLDHINGFPFLDYSDDWDYQNQAASLAGGWLDNGAVDFSSLYRGSYSGYRNLGALLMYAFDSTEWWVPRTGNVVIMSFGIVCMYRILRRTYGKRSGRLYATLFAFSPFFITYCIVNLKDVIILTILLFAFMSIYNILMRRGIRTADILICLAMLSLLLFFRPAIIFTFIAAVSGVLLLVGESKLSAFRRVLVFCLILAGLFVSWNYLSEIGMSAEPDIWVDSKMDVFSGERVVGERSAVSGTGLAVIASAPLYFALSLFLPVATSYYIPQTYYVNFEFVCTLFVMALVPFFICSMFTLFKSRPRNLFLWFLFFFLIIYKLGESFSMSVFTLRHSLPAELCLLMLVPLAGEAGLPRNIWRGSVMIMVFIFFGWNIFRYLVRLT